MKDLVMTYKDIDIDIDIDIPKIISGNHDVDEFLKNINNIKHHQISDCMNNIDKNSNFIKEVYEYVRNILTSSITTKWIPYSRITNLEKIAEGGFSIIYKATTLINGTVAVKKILNSRDISKCFLNEVIIIFFIL